jgi:hypothetical protein
MRRCSAHIVTGVFVAQPVLQAALLSAGQCKLQPAFDRRRYQYQDNSAGLANGLADNERSLNLAASYYGAFLGMLTESAPS